MISTSIILVSVGSGRRGATLSDRGPNTYTMWATLLDYILSLRQWVFSLWTFLSCGRDKEHTDLCVLIIPQEQAWLRVLARPGRFVPSTIPREQGKIIVTMPKFVRLRDFSKNPHGSTSTPSFALQFSQFSRWAEDIGPKVVTPLCVPLTVEMFACATSTAHYHRTCRPLYPRHGGRDYPKFSFNLLLMTFHDPVQEVAVFLLWPRPRPLFISTLSFNSHRMICANLENQI